MLEVIKKHKLLVFFAIMLLVISIFFGTKIFLYINFLLGNDVIVKLSVDKEYVFLEGGEKEDLRFEAKVTANPFCKAQCEHRFVDLGNNELIGKAEFFLKPGMPFMKDYSLKADKTGEGFILYQFSMECHSISTLLCHTKEEPTKRDILVVVHYALNSSEKEAKEVAQQKLVDTKQRLEALQGLYEAARKQMANMESAIELNESVYEQLNLMNISVNGYAQKMKELQSLWSMQAYLLLLESADELSNQINFTENTFLEFNESINKQTNLYNTLIEELELTKADLGNLTNTFLTDNNQAAEINHTISSFNDVIPLFKQKSGIAEKKKMVKRLSEEAKQVSSTVFSFVRNETLKRQIELDINKDALCEVTKICLSHPSIEVRANQTSFELKNACKDAEDFVEQLLRINESMRGSFEEQNYPEDDAFWQNITLKIKNMKQTITNTYLDNVLTNASSEEFLKQILIRKPLIETSEYSEYNLTPALIKELTNQQKPFCQLHNVSIATLVNIESQKIEPISPVNVALNVSFDEPLPLCCLSEICSTCCVTDECKKDANLPIIFLHGHAFNKDVSAEYSLDAFNKIQSRLEKDGYINAGAISLYTSKETPQGIWGLHNTSVTIKTSYYLDMFQAPDNYVVVQLKSEGIDAYAVRLKELIDIIKYRTGKQKVDFIAHSMGGLVVRRYIQLFGNESINKVILIGTPNKGIVEDILNYCSLIGEKRECRDMNSESIFINKLNNEKTFAVPAFNIVGAGCKMKEGIGDGIILERNAFLKEATNYLINGTCQGRKSLHTQLLDIDMHPEVYGIIKDVLKK